MGGALADQRKPGETIEHYQQAMRLRPGFADAHESWGLAPVEQGKLAEAAEHFEQAMQIKPSNAQAQSDLLNALPGRGTGKEDAPPEPGRQQSAIV